MKNLKMKNLSLAALLIASVTFVACSSDNDIINENQLPSSGKYTMTIQASKGDEAATRALSLDGSTLNATWAEGERVTVYNKSKNANLEGYLEAQGSGASTILKGTLSGTIETNDELVLKFLSPDYGTQDGTLEYIASHCDYAEATATVSGISDGNITTTASASFENKQAIAKFTLLKKADNSELSIPANTALTVNDGTNDYTVTPIKATNVLFVAIPATENVKLNTTIDGTTYDFEKAGAALTAGQYYEISVKMGRTVDLSIYKQGGIEALILLNGDKVSGKFIPKRQISIAAGATVTLCGVTINDLRDNNTRWTDGSYAGLTCLGDATIILAEGTENKMWCFQYNYPGIYVPEGKTLTIKGSGSLYADGSQSAGIGSGYENNLNCGNIVIEGGTIVAWGGRFSAAIGSGCKTRCGNITITSGVTSVTARKYEGLDYPNFVIGAGFEGSCGTVTIGGVVGQVTNRSSYTYPVYLNNRTETEEFTAYNHDILRGTLNKNIKISIADGANVWLDGVTINGVSENETTYQWAGINCMGDATINLIDGTTNTVKGFYREYPGIYVPEGKTLTINGGTGELTASSNGRGSGIGSAWEALCGNITINGGVVTAVGAEGGAGIGCAYGSNARCGDIVINGGTVHATGSYNGAGIGAGQNVTGQSEYNHCGNITINGGTVTAITTGKAAGIGTGYMSKCGNITIGSGVTSVSAQGGLELNYICIGASYNGHSDACGSVTFGNVGNVVVLNGTNWVAPSDGTYGGLIFVKSTTNTTNDTWTLTPAQ